MKLQIKVLGMGNPVEVESPIIPEEGTSIEFHNGSYQGNYKVTNVKYQVVEYAHNNELKIFVTLDNA